MTFRFFYHWAAVASITTGIILALTGCGVTIGPDGKPLITLDGAAVAEIADQAADRINRRLVDSTSGK